MIAIKSVQRVYPIAQCSGIDKSKGLQRVDLEGAPLWQLEAASASMGGWAFIPCLKAGLS